MKKITLVLTAFFSVFSLLAQQHDQHDQHAPAQVSQSFHHQYPQAENPMWVNQNGQWQAHFNDQGPESRGEMVAHYDHDGRNTDSYIRYDQQDVPQPVTHWAESHYKHGHSYEYTMIERPGESDFFQIRVNLSGKYHTYYVDEYGHERNYHH